MHRSRLLNPRSRHARSAGLAIAAFASVFLLLGEATAAGTGTLDRVRETGKLKLGYPVDARPFAYRDSSGNAGGYAVALCQTIAADAKAALKLPTLAVEFVPVTAGDAVTALQQGRIDLLCGATPTLKRRSEVSFSIPVFATGIGALLREDAPARLKDVLSGREPPNTPNWRATAGQVLQKRVFSVVAGSRTEQAVVDRLKEVELVVEVLPVKDSAAGVQGVLKHQADVFFADRAILLDAAAHGPAADDLIVLDRFFTHEAIAFALPRGDEDFRLFVDRSLSRLFRSNEIGPLYEKYFGKLNENARIFFQLSALPE